MSNNKSIIFFATSWSAANGGVNSFNMDLCNAIANTGINIYIFLPVGADNSSEPRENIQLKILPTTFSDFNKKSVNFVLEELPSSQEFIWVGHDAISGGAALFMRNSAGGRCIIFHHMDYSNYYYLKKSDSAEKIRIQKHLLKSADVVIGVGPRLTSSAKHIRPRHAETYSIEPGVPAFQSEHSREFDYRIAICGRLSVSEDKVKNLTAGVKGAVNALQKLPTKRGCITLLGSTPSDVAAMHLTKGASIAINPVPYINSRDEYFSELQDADLVLMPSVREGFGLVAWEALALGIPVLVSKSSGFFELLQQLELAELVSSVEISGVAAIDEVNIAAHIYACLSEYPIQKANAKKAAEIIQTKTWQRAAERFLSLASGPTELPVGKDSESATISSKPEIKQEKPRPIALNKEAQSAGFERFEDVLALTAKRRKLLLPKQETTDFSRNQKIKFEYWATFSPQPSYFLYIHPTTNLKQTLKRFCQLLRTTNQEAPAQLFVLRRDKGENQYIQRLAVEENLSTTIADFSLKDYIWDYCIDENFKRKGSAEAPLYYIDQKISIQGRTQDGPSARELLLEKLGKTPEFNAHLVVAPGGMGKTWLCRSIAAGLSNDQTENRLVVLIQAENLREYIAEVGSAHIQVTSVFDLYELHARSQNSECPYDRGTFELAVICGNIVLIVDGLDELATVLQERFDLSKFLDSVVELSSSLLSSHILLTTRDSLLVDDSATSKFGIARYELLGFDDSDWKRYAAKRFRTNEHKELIVSKLTSVLNSLIFADETGRIVPFFVDVLCNIIEDDASLEETQSFDLSNGITPYHSNNEITDHLIHSIFRREIRRQSIDLDIDQLIALVAELISEQGDNFGQEALLHALELLYETRAVGLLQKISLNPLFQKGVKSLRLRYDFLQSYFRSLFLIECLQKNLHTPEALNAFAKSNATESPEVAYLRKYYQGKAEILDDQLFEIVPKFREQARSSDNKRAELGRRAISGVLKIYIAARGFGTAKVSEKIIELFPTPSMKKTIDGLAVYGDFPPLDFSETTVFNSKFLDYKNFGRGKFEGAKFISCIFENCVDETQLNSTLHLAEFETSCTLGDVATLVSSSRSHQIIEEQTLEQECLTFLRCFFKYGAPYDPKPIWIKFSPKVRGLKQKVLEKLVPEYLFVKSQKGSDTHYELSPSFISSARNFIDNNYIDATMRKFMAYVK